MDKIPVKIAKEVAEKTGMSQVIIWAWDKTTQHAVTYGKTIEDCSQAATGGNAIKEFLGWKNFNDQPSRVKKLEKENKELRELLGKTKQ